MCAQRIPGYMMRDDLISYYTAKRESEMTLDNISEQHKLINEYTDRINCMPYRELQHIYRLVLITL